MADTERGNEFSSDSLGGSAIQNSWNPKLNKAVSDFDARHLVNGDALYVLPVGRGKRFSTNNRLIDYVLGNWQLNNIFTWRNGQPFTATDSTDRANVGGGGQRANQVGNPNRGSKNVNEWFNTDAFALPALYTYGNAGRNTLQAQRWINLDSSVIRSFPIWHEKRFEFRAEAFNIFNHPIFGIPNDDVSSNTFGAVNNSQANSSRQLQVSGKIVF